MATPPADAQTQPPATQPGTQTATVNDKDINAFAAAASEIRQLNQKWLPRVKAAGQQGAAAEQQAKQQALAEMTQAVEKNGLTVAKYNEIYQIAQANPEVRKQVQDRMQPAEQPNDQNSDEDDGN